MSIFDEKRFPVENRKLNRDRSAAAVALGRLFYDASLSEKRIFLDQTL